VSNEAVLTGRLDYLTDSGYGGLDRRLKSNHPQTALEHREHPDSDYGTASHSLSSEHPPPNSVTDTESTLGVSALSSFGSGRLDVYITEFAEEIATAFPRTVPKESLIRVSELLPDLLTAFVGRLGWEVATALSSDHDKLKGINDKRRDWQKGAGNIMLRLMRLVSRYRE
jgi:hypothetical protein